MDYESIIAGSSPAGGTVTKGGVNMETFEYMVLLQVNVAAFSDTDARDLLLDNFGEGDDGGIEIVGVAIKEIA